jgi:RNA recognition motif-containing protein
LFSISVRFDLCHGLELVLGEDKLSKKIYVGNLSFDATEEQVREMFEAHGTVESVALINDRDTGRFRGFGFVEMDDASANKAIQALDGAEVDGRALKVNEARPREERPRSSFGGERRSGGGGSYGGGGNRSGGGGNRSGGGGGNRRW